MDISIFKDLIINLPVRNQCFTVKRENLKWKEAEKRFQFFNEFNDKYFINERYTLSRQDIFDTNDRIQETVIKTIFWGYPNGMQGGHEYFGSILDSIENNNLTIALNELKSLNNATENDFFSFVEKMKEIKGIGLSTYSKILYFLDIKINSIPAVILDNRLISVINDNFYDQFNHFEKITESNRESNYLNYIKTIYSIANSINTKSENIEQFLFIFGNHLKLSTEKITLNQSWNGYCPESHLLGKQVRMRLNSLDLYESEKTGLQISIFPGLQAVILKERGNGKFRSTPQYGDEIENGELLSPQNSDMPPFNSPAIIFTEGEEIEAYIKAIK